MTSKRIEDVHVDMLNRLLSESGLECLRSLSVSEESSTLLGEEETEEENEEELVPEEALIEEEKLATAEVIPEELPYLFPTPSLRRVLPERIRKVHEQNRIHVLPEVFRADIDHLQIPKIAITPPQKYIDILAEMVGCEMYKSSLPEYWFLDTLANLLRRAQDDDMHRVTQAVLIQWFCEWMKEIQYFDAADRQRMLRRFEDIMLQASHVIADEDKLPTPREARVSYKALEEEEQTEAPSTSRQQNYTSAAKMPDPHKVEFEGTAFECSLKDLIQIMHYLFDLFSSDFQYNLVRSIFTFTPDYAQVDTPYQIQTPKRLFIPEKGKKKEKSPKKKEEKKPGKGKIKEVLTEEYIALMAFKAREEREIEEREEIEREEWLKKSSILPLNFAADDALFDKYWPPPPPEPQPLPPPPVDNKGKGGKGKK